MTHLGFDATQHERSVGEGNQPLPFGVYGATITRATMKDCSARAKDPQGKYLEVEFAITSPQAYDRRLYWEKFNLINKEQTTVKIAKEQLSDLAQALGFSVLNDSEDLLGKSCSMVVSVTPAKGDFSAGNKVLKFMPSGEKMEDYDAWLANKRGKTSTQTEQPKQSEQASQSRNKWKK